MSTQTDNRTQAMTFTPTKTNPVHVLSLDEIKSVVPDEEAAIAYLEEQRWGESRHCVREVDEVHLGGVEKNKHAKKKLGVGGGTGGKQPVLRLKDRGNEAPRAHVLFAHCFTCTKDVFAATRIATALAEKEIAVLRFDFTGLGESKGDFPNSNFSSNVGDLVSAADFMRQRYALRKYL